MTKTKKNKILIVEDEEALRKSLAFALKKSGFEVDQAENGAKGIEAAEKLHPDLMLLDLLMPEKDGFEVLKELRGNSWGKEIPVVILTNLSGSEYVADTIQYGVYDHLVKSDWSVDDVVRVVKGKLAK